MIYLREYAVASEVYAPLVTAGSADFKVNPETLTADFSISLDGGSFTTLDTTPTEVPAGGVQIKFALSEAELTCKTAVIVCIDDAGAQWEDSMIIIETYGHASAQHAFNLNEAQRGTDNAATATNLATVDTVVDGIQTDLSNGADGLGALKTLIDAAATVVNAVKTVTDALPNSGALTGISTSTDRLTAERAAVLTDWVNNGRLDLLLDAIPITPMRGTDNAALASVCTEARLQALTDWINGGRLDNLLDSLVTLASSTSFWTLQNVTTLGVILGDTNEIQSDWKDTGRLDVILDAIKVVTDALPNSGALTGISASTDRLTAERAAVLTDWINGGRLDLLLGAIPTTAMRGTDNAALAATAFNAAADAVNLAATGLDSIAIAEVTGLATKWSEMIVQLWRAEYKKRVLHKTDDSSGTMSHRNDADDANLLQSPYTEDATDQTMEESS